MAPRELETKDAIFLGTYTLLPAVTESQAN